MKGKLTLQQRLVMPILLLGLITLLSNLLAVFGINNVHANAGTIVDEYMVSEARLEEIRRSMMNIHRLALSHIVAADHATMITLVQEIKASEKELDQKLADYAVFVSEDDGAVYRTLLEDYDAFKHALVHLVSASADSRTQAAYAVANGDVSTRSAAAESGLDALSASGTSFPGICCLPRHQRSNAGRRGISGVGGSADYTEIRHRADSGRDGYPAGQLPAHQRRCGRGPQADPYLQQQRAGALPSYRTALRRPAGDCRKHRRDYRQRIRHPERHGEHGGGVLRYHRLFRGNAGPTRRWGWYGPGRRKLWSCSGRPSSRAGTWTGSVI